MDNFNLSATKRVRIKKNTVTHVKRVLQGKGKLAAIKNQEVSPQDIIGTATVSSGYTNLKLAQKLEVSAKDGEKYLQRPKGSNFYKGELLALKKGMFGKKIVTAPTDCIVEDYNKETGELRLKFLPKQVPLTAGVFGIVDKVEPLTGEVTIKTMVTEVIGILGSGMERCGFLQIIETPGLVSEQLITSTLTQKVVVFNGLMFGETLRKAVGFGIHGIITGGLNAADYLAMVNTLDPTQKLGNDIGASIIATEGFGGLQVGIDIMEVIKSYQNHFVFIEGNTSRLILPSFEVDSILSLRKVTLPLEKIVAPQEEMFIAPIDFGNKVRMIGAPFIGVQGKVVGIDKSPTLLESGISTILLTIETKSRKIKVPFSNVEIII